MKKETLRLLCFLKTPSRLIGQTLLFNSTWSYRQAGSPSLFLGELFQTFLILHGSRKGKQPPPLYSLASLKSLSSRALSLAGGALRYKGKGNFPSGHSFQVLESWCWFDQERTLGVYQDKFSIFCGHKAGLKGAKEKCRECFSGLAFAVCPSILGAISRGRVVGSCCVPFMPESITDALGDWSVWL